MTYRGNIQKSGAFLPSSYFSVDGYLTQHVFINFRVSLCCLFMWVYYNRIKLNFGELFKCNQFSERAESRKNISMTFDKNIVSKTMQESSIKSNKLNIDSKISTQAGSDDNKKKQTNKTAKKNI